MNDPQEELDQWLAYRREKTANLDISQAVQRELVGFSFSAPSPAEDAQSLRFPFLRISISALIRLGVFVGWVAAST